LRLHPNCLNPNPMMWSYWILWVYGVFDLLDLAVKKNLKVVMLTAHALSSEALKKII